MIGAPQPLVLAKPAAIDTAQAARYFGARGEPDDRTMTLLETCAMPLLAAATPQSQLTPCQLPQGGSLCRKGKLFGFAKGPIPEGAVCEADWGSSFFI